MSSEHILLGMAIPDGTTSDEQKSSKSSVDKEEVEGEYLADTEHIGI